MAFVAAIVTAFILFQVYIIAKVLLKVNPDLKKRKSFKWMKRISYCVPVFIMIVSSIILFFVKIIHLHFVSWKEWLPYIHSSFVIYLWINLVFNYLAASVSKPGRPPKKQEILVDLNENFTNKTEDNVSQLSFCEKCKRLSTYGTQHCNKCETCFRMLCHHSYIVNNCIGLTNYVYYFLFLIYGFVGLLYSLYMLYGPFHACYIHDHTFSNVSLEYPALSEHICNGIGELPLLFIIALAAFLVISCLLVLHCLLLAADISYNTFLKNLKESDDKVKTISLLMKKAFQKHKRMKFNMLLRTRKENWLQFLYPSFVMLPDDLCSEDLFDEDECYVQMV